MARPNLPPQLPVAHYSITGDGNPSSPACVHFNLGACLNPGLANIRQALPSSINVKVDDLGGYNLTAVDPTTSRTDLGRVFYRLCQRMRWQPRSHEA